MAELDLLFKARRVVTAAGEVARSIGVRDGTVIAVEPLDADLEAAEVIELGDDEVLLPGLVDSHVHVNDPGRTEWEGFGSATRAAAAGGITTIIDMPLNSVPPTTDVAALQTKRKTAEGRVYVDVGFWGGAVPGNLRELRGLHDSGVFGFKCFLLHSGVDEFPHLEPGELADALREIGAFDALMIVHAEDPHVIDHAPAAHGASYRDFLRSRPRGAENLAVAQVIELARRTGCRVHILHLSSSDALAMIRSARRDGVRITVETCPHYLTFSAEEIAEGATQFKCCPPIREAANRESLWQGLADGTIDCVVSDHSPCTPELKRFDVGDFGVAWGGIASLQLGLPAVWTEARRRGHTLTDVVRWMAERPAELMGVHRKGRIETGYQADFCVFAPDEVFVVDRERLHHRNPVTPYHGRPLAGVVRGSWLRGVPIDIDSLPQGRLLNGGGA
ncbi:allantoinase AllB [Streptosporangium roseum]|uniref:allantoinase n=1 Tax=Streptosporangium roseum (strain ATCC 12428 / DSM 43021 / JCM 3005 / KCTC 9067 / NCIMB 10171 / NRRL 2505 / NI 9100) TaxID=479432 RepID=D2B6T6_STRRD|nr:allantoinase AllB [Streptosporangium roseum]ACZ87674.1 allantoinase [Streptosporangium roseum DSM 43021]